MGSQVTVQSHPQGRSQGNANIGVASTQVGGALQEQYHENNGLQGYNVTAFCDIHHLTGQLEILEPEQNVSL
jgi:hypothetical protein